MIQWAFSVTVYTRVSLAVQWLGSALPMTQVQFLVAERGSHMPHGTAKKKKKKEKIKLKNIHQTPKFYSVGKASCGKACVCKMPHSVFAYTRLHLNLRRPHICCVCREGLWRGTGKLTDISIRKETYKFLIKKILDAIWEPFLIASYQMHLTRVVALVCACSVSLLCLTLGSHGL